MSPVQCFREFVNERLTVAAEEIFRAFEKTIVDYEEEINRQRRLLESVWKSEVKLHKIEVPQQHDYKEEDVLTDQQLCNQGRDSSLDQEDPEPPQIKEEQEELCISQDEEQLVLKQETDSFMLTLTYEEGGHSEDQTLCLNPDECQSAAERECVDNIEVRSSEESQQNHDHQLLPHVSHLAESQHHRGDSVSTGNAEIKPQKRHYKSNYVRNPTIVKINCNTCGKEFRDMYKLNRHLRIHTGEKPYSCDFCGKSFKQTSALKVHIRIHTGEKPYSCNICGKGYGDASNLKRHIVWHTGEKPNLCNTCGKSFYKSSSLKKHIIIHTGESANT